MNRYLIVEEQNGRRSAHGTGLQLESGSSVWITSHPLDPALGLRYFVSPEGLASDALPILEATELFHAAPGVAQTSIAPYVYELKIGQRK